MERRRGPVVLAVCAVGVLGACGGGDDDGSGGGGDGGGSFGTNVDERTAEYAGTADDPYPMGVAIPVEHELTQGLVVRVDGVDLDAAARIVAEGGDEPYVDEGEQVVLVDVTVALDGRYEDWMPHMVYFSTEGFAETEIFGRCTPSPAWENPWAHLLSGGVVSTAQCAEVPTAAVDDLLIGVSYGFGDTQFHIDPGTTVDPYELTATSGPQSGATLTPERESPIALGTAGDLDLGWELTVHAADLAGETSAPEAALAPDESLVVVDLSLRYDGDESDFPGSTSPFVVGDSNVGYSRGCTAELDSEIDWFGDVAPGEEVRGEVCFQVPTSEVDSLLLVAGGMLDWENGDVTHPRAFALR